MFAAGKAVSGAAPTDAQFNYVTMLLHGDGTNGAQNNTFLDSSTNNFTITRNGNTTQGTFSPYGSNWSNYFDGGTSTRLTLASNSAFAFGTGAYTIEAWVYLSSYAANQGSIFDSGNATGALDFFIVSTGALGIGEYGVGNILSSSSSAVSLNTWTHVAVVRNSTSTNDTKLYVNGSLVATGTDTKNWTVTTTPSIGGINLSGYSTTGYISNLRVVKGTAVYTSAFTPPTTPLTAITNTSLLTCADNRFIDDSTNAFAITVNGNTSVQRFSPFSPTTAYSTSVIGGSGYFDGSGDYLNNTTNNTALAMGTGDFTIEFWMNSPSSASQVIYDSRLTTSSSNGGMQIYHDSGTIYFYGGSLTNVLLTSASITYNQWNHVAVVRSGSSTGNVKMYINGALASTYGSADTANYAQGYLVLGAFNNPSASTFYNGYLSDFRLVKGTAVYTSAFTPPTAPLTAVTNTSLLLSNTNAGILDNAMMNDLETVGNAQISTSVKKYGTGSIAFDGTTDYIVEPTNLNFGYGTGDFTIEFWLYLNSLADQTIVSNLTSGSSVNPHIYYSSAGGIRYYTNNADRIIGSSLSTSTWYHIAICRSSGSTRLFINGTQSGSTYADSNNYGTSAPLGIATYWLSGSPVTASTLNGYLDDIRITRGVGRYTANFTAPTAPFPDKG